jgi:hypothetical protein
VLQNGIKMGGNFVAKLQRGFVLPKRSGSLSGASSGAFDHASASNRLRAGC